MCIWPAGRTSDGRLRACCVMDRSLACPRVRCAAADGLDPSHGSATRSRSSSVTQHFPNFLKIRKSPAFLGHLGLLPSRQYFMPFEISRSYFRWRAGLSVEHPKDLRNTLYYDVVHTYGDEQTFHNALVRCSRIMPRMSQNCDKGITQSKLLAERDSCDGCS